jgi:hypothetical protein
MTARLATLHIFPSLQSEKSVYFCVIIYSFRRIIQYAGIVIV